MGEAGSHVNKGEFQLGVDVIPGEGKPGAEAWGHAEFWGKLKEDLHVGSPERKWASRGEKQGVCKLERGQGPQGSQLSRAHRSRK